ncbi:bifunctional 2-keto-4-hydroxyglutarate aldolase/2-keto-3-deoxy-6-phosphogluconate aldolase [Pigmentiphaga aceris]|uniref:Bifunctional 2-keto-4-hydroxyglutarate aldolase/2-keto-3-deoxy-6-phosphogluconate aldolase n=1 Tax=Pigmentiphaga aceris TaxID=1940612 RepID=A0A5C0AXU2_9BURK|nr:bifunctional 2-keto-4-hydroxyglutarate aldolase/2-keto-3-deoxy-6-phosphogluconate aldolase [Pigmentiphaga aceris]QEI06384.1 bifunctional 2-keto-4-hydroxyglutarate aldolase/2-keto-3-deoxy-6-phosphogluconate aldolase [Pigmentiphaga aceris]
MKKIDTLHRLRTSRIVAVIRESNPDAAHRTALACIDGGIDCLEIAMTTPCGLDVVESLALLGGGLTIGAGTVLDAPTARSAIQMGASFVASPVVNADVVRMCSRYGVVSMPGTFTPTEVVTALEAGADIVRIFPAASLGPQHLAHLISAFPQAVFMPGGGAGLATLRDWLVPGVIAVAVGADLTTHMGDDYGAVTTRARQLMAAAKETTGRVYLLDNRNRNPGSARSAVSCQP